MTVSLDPEQANEHVQSFPSQGGVTVSLDPEQTVIFAHIFSSLFPSKAKNRIFALRLKYVLMQSR